MVLLIFCIALYREKQKRMCKPAGQICKPTPVGQNCTEEQECTCTGYLVSMIVFLLLFVMVSIVVILNIIKWYVHNLYTFFAHACC